MPNGISIGSAVSLHSSQQRDPISYNGPPLPLKIVPSHGEIWTPSNTWFLDRFSRFAGLTIATDRQTDQATPSVTIGRMYLMLRCSLKLNNVNSENIVKY